MVSSRFKRSSNIVNIILTMILVVGIIISSFSVPDAEAAFSASAAGFANSLGKYYPLLNVFIKAATELDIVSMIVFPLVSISLFAVFCLIIAKRYRNTCSLISSIGGKAKKFSNEDMQVSSVLKSLYQREMRQYFSSTVYVINTAIGAVMAILFSAVVMVNRGIPLMSGVAEGEMAFLNSLFYTLAPICLSMLIGMSCTTGSSISIEGNKLWVLKALPVETRTIFLAKILISLTISVPTGLICSALLAVGLKFQGFSLIVLFLMPQVFVVFSASFGLIVNLHLPKLDWQTETQVVKQSAASMLSILTPMLYCIALLVGLIVLMSKISGASYDQVIATYLLIAVIIPAISTGIIWRFLKKNGEKKFKSL